MTTWVDVKEAVRQYAEGEVGLQEAVDMFRQMKPTEHQFAESPFENEWIDEEGGVTDLVAAGMLYDLTAEEVDYLAQAFDGHPVGEAGAPEPKPEFDEDASATLEDLLAPGDDDDTPDLGERQMVVPPNDAVSREMPKKKDDDDE